MKKRHGIDTVTQYPTVLSVSANDEDCRFLERVLNQSDLVPYTKSEWTVLASPTLASAFSVLRETSIPIVLCEGDLLPGTWRDMLEHISLLPDPPLLIVTAPLADERLWVEALNLGAYDVLARPFDTQEVARIVNLAWQHWQDRHELDGKRSTQRISSTGT